MSVQQVCGCVKKKRPRRVAAWGAIHRIRTDDLFITSELLYQLS